VSENDDVLSIDVQSSDSEALLTITGELDPHTATEFAEAVGKLQDDEQVVRLVLDMSGIRFIDSSGLRVLLAADQAFAARGGSLIVRSPSDVARRLLEITDLLDRFEVE
jgi:anti-sigma B factor antagonist